jgi:hypothetical protein
MKWTILALGAALSGAASAQEIDLFAMADTSRDERIAQAEFADFREMGWDYFFSGQDSVNSSHAPEAKGLLAGVEPDPAGKVTHAAFTAAAPAIFKQADKNGDGSLNRAEFEAVMPPPGG